MTDYYVSPTGNNNASGTSPATAWQTLRRVQLAGTGFGPLFPGDRILFERGATFYGYLDIPGFRAELSAKVHVGAYGVGPKPIITAYKRINSDAWELHAPNIWKVAIADPTKFAGNTMTTGAAGVNTGFLRVDGEIKGFKRFSIETLAADWEFFSDGDFYSETPANILYVYSATNPGTRAQEIMQAPNQSLIIPRRALSISGIHFQGTGGHVHGGSTQDFDFEGNEVSEIGGCQLTPDIPESRYGNGIQFYTVDLAFVGGITGTTLTVASVTRGALAIGLPFSGPGVLPGTYIVSGAHPTWTLNNNHTVAVPSGTTMNGVPTKRCNVRRNSFRDIYDVAMTLQGPGISFPTAGWEDVEFTDNVSIRCAQAVEFWCRFGVTDNLGTPPAGSGFRRVKYERNVDIDSGRGWEAATRPTYPARASLLTFALEAAELDITIRDNIHINPEKLVYNFFPLPTALKWTRSRVFGPSTTKISYHGEETLDEFDAYIARTGVAGQSLAQCAQYDTEATLQNALDLLMQNAVSMSARMSAKEAGLVDVGGELRSVRAAVEGLREQPVSLKLTYAEMGLKVSPDGALAVGPVGNKPGLIEAHLGKWRRLSLGGVADIPGDANTSFQYINAPSLRRYTGTLTANREDALSATGMIPGAMFMFSRTGGDTGGLWYRRIRNSDGTVLADLYANQWCIAAASETAPYPLVVLAKGSLT